MWCVSKVRHLGVYSKKGNKHFLTLLLVQIRRILLGPFWDIVKITLDVWWRAMENHFCNGDIIYIFPVFDLRGDLYARSLTIVRKRIEPNLVPCGNVGCTGAHFDSSPPSLTTCRRWERKLQIHLIILRQTPISNSLPTRMLWSIWSKALLTLRKHTLRKLTGHSSAIKNSYGACRAGKR